MKKQKLFLTMGAIGAALSLTSCFQVTQNVALNPDGSGKFVYKSVGDATGGALAGLLGGVEGAEKPDPEEMAKSSLQLLLQSSGGVDVWEKATYSVDAKGKTTLNASGYFKDVTKLSLNSGGGSMDSDLEFKKDASGNLVLSMKMDDEGHHEAVESTAEKPDAATVETKLKEQRAQWAQQKLMMSQFIKGLEFNLNVKMPGKIIETANFKKKSDDVAGFGFTGEKMLAAMDKVIMDDAIAKKIIADGGDLTGGGAPPLPEDELSELMFGEKGGVKVVAKPSGKALFDYAAHTAKAEANQSDELKAMLEAKPAEGFGGFDGIEIDSNN